MLLFLSQVNSNQYLVKDNAGTCYFCNFCPYNTAYRYSMTRHVNSHTKESGVTLDDTTRGFTVKENYGKKYFCKLCKFKSSAVNVMKQHLESHVGAIQFTTEVKNGTQQYSCIQCSYQTLSTQCINKHILSHQNGEQSPKVKPQSPPSESPLKMEDDDALQNYSVHIIEGAKQFCCNLCEFSTFIPYSIKRHLLTHNRDQMLKCEYPDCDYKSTNRYSMNKHNAKYHTMDGLFKCPYCKYKGADKLRLKRHIDVHIRLNEAPRNAVELHDQLANEDFSSEAVAPSTPVRISQDNLVFQKLAASKQSKTILLNTEPMPQASHRSLDESESELKDVRRDIPASDISMPPPPILNTPVINKAIIYELKTTSGAPVYKCSLCTYLHPDVNSVRCHIVSHKYANFMFCDFCSFKSKDIDNMKIHLCLHKPIGLSVCPLCEYTCNNSYRMRSHIDRHYKNSWMVDEKSEKPLMDVQEQMMEQYYSTQLFETERKLSETYQQNIRMQVQLSLGGE